jgi:hypothetical protein
MRFSRIRHYLFQAHHTLKSRTIAQPNENYDKVLFSGTVKGRYILISATGNFVPGDLTEKVNKVDDVEEKASTEKFD